MRDRSIAARLDIRRISFLVCRGGWPKASLKTNERAALIEAREYVESVCRNDISRVDDVQRNAELARRLMRSYSRHQGAQVSVATILADIKSNEASDTTEATVASYINALKRIFVIEDMAAWNPNLRSKTAIRSSDTRYFTDPSIAAAALGRPRRPAGRPKHLWIAIRDHGSARLACICRGA